MAAAFITFEGIDGCGKSTQLRMLASELRLRSHEVVTTREPGGTPLGIRLRELLLDIEEQVDPLTELLLYAADRAQHVRTLIRPALASGHIVLSDRYADATVAYQGAGRGFPSSVITELVQLATEGLKPDLTLLFDLPVEECRARSARRAHGNEEAQNRLDMESLEFHNRVREGYLQLARAEPERFRIIDTSGPVQEIHTRVLEIIRMLPSLETPNFDNPAPS